MSRSKKIASMAFTGAVATGATMMGAAPAFAGTSRWYVHRSSATGRLYTGQVKAMDKGTTELVDTIKHTTLTCKKAFASGNVSVKSGLNGTVDGVKYGVLKKSATKWSSCTGPDDLTFKAKLIANANMVVKSANANSALGRLSGISFKISGTGLFNTCKATISGSIPAIYVNGSHHSYSFNPRSKVTLTITKVSGFCGGGIAARDEAYFKGTYHVSTPAGLTINSNNKS